MKHFLFAFASILLFSVGITAQTPLDICRVTTSWMSISEKRGGGIYEIGWFQPTEFEDETLKTFKHDETGIFVSIKVEYGDFPAVEKGKPTEIELSISISNKEQEALMFSEGISSKTTYGKRWGNLSVQRLITIGDLVHTFRISCNDGRKEWKRKIFSKKT